MHWHVGNFEEAAVRRLQDARSAHLDVYASTRVRTELENITDDIVFEIELIKQAEIMVDDILLLLQKYRDERGDSDYREFIDRAFAMAPSRPLESLLPPASSFAAGGGHGEKQQRVLARLGEFFERYFGLG